MISPGAGINWVRGGIRGMAGCQHKVSVFYRGSSGDQRTISETALTLLRIGDDEADISCVTISDFFVLIGEDTSLANNPHSIVLRKNVCIASPHSRCWDSIVFTTRSHQWCH